MPQPHPAEIVRAGAEVRGTQSFVHVMASVWKRPSLTAIEVLWRWAIGLPSLWLIATCGWRIWLGATGGTADPARLHLAHITVTDPFGAAQRLTFAGSQLLPPVLHAARWLVPLLLAAWVAVSAVGRTAVLRRMDPSLPPRRAASRSRRTKVVELWPCHKWPPKFFKSLSAKDFGQNPKRFLNSRIARESDNI